MQSNSKNTTFKPKWEVECGVKVTSRDANTGAVVNAVCLFCTAFGREEDYENLNRKRRRTQNIQSFCAPWRIDKLKKHHLSMHKKNGMSIKSVRR